MAEVQKDGLIAKAYADLHTARMQANGLRPEPRSRKAQAPLGEAPDPIISSKGPTRDQLRSISKPPAKKAS